IVTWVIIVQAQKLFEKSWLAIDSIAHHLPLPHLPIERHLHWIRLGSSGLQCIDSPHGKVTDKQKGDHLSTGLPANLICRAGLPFGGIQYENRLQRRLDETGKGVD